MSDNFYYVASCSFGKDSNAMVRELINRNMPLDEVVFYDTGVEFSAIYAERDRLLPVLTAHNIKYTELHPERPFFYDMLEKPVFSKKNGHHCGYGWCGGVTRWGTAMKTATLNKHFYEISKKGYILVQYIGIAADETERIQKNRKKNVILPLVEWKLTESDCLTRCYDAGATWDENGVRLYDILDRVSCWCCANKNTKELRNIYRYLPEYWDKFKQLQSVISKPIKASRTNKNGHITPAKSIFDYDQIFASELKE